MVELPLGKNIISLVKNYIKLNLEQKETKAFLLVIIKQSAQFHPVASHSLLKLMRTMPCK